MPTEHTKHIITVFKPHGFSLEFIINNDKKTEHKSELKIQKDETIRMLERDLMNRYQEDPNDMLFYFAFMDLDKKLSLELSDSIVFLHRVGKFFIKDLSKLPPETECSDQITIEPSDGSAEKLVAQMPFIIGRDYVDLAWIKQIYSRLSLVLSWQMKQFGGTIEAFLENRNAHVNMMGRVYFHLVESQTEDYPFAFLATYSQLKENSNHMPLKNALLEFQNNKEQLLKLLSTVSKAAQKSKLISELVESGEIFSALKFTVKEAYTFLTEIPVYEDCGILCRIPDWWKKQSQKVKLSVQIGDIEPSHLGLEAILDFDASLHIGDEIISEREVREILSQANGLSLIKGKWVEVNHDTLAATLKAYENAKALASKGVYTLAQAMRLHLTAGESFNTERDEIEIEVSHGHWLEALRNKMLGQNTTGAKENHNVDEVELGNHFNTTLRPYQLKGVQWLNLMKSIGFGACLADDMGLGKTVQIIAMLEHMRINEGSTKETKTKILLIMPASLMGNWQREIEKFAPLLKFRMIYSTKDIVDFKEYSDYQSEVILTTYGMLTRTEVFKNTLWDMLILDEAQAIKNPNTKQTKAVKQLESKNKIALTGTPIENSLTDLWSLFDFLNKGLLGSAKEFKILTKKLRGNEVSYSELREVVSPFVLRRLKTDKSVIDTLPEKLEMKAYTTLTKKQVVLYTSLVKDLEKQLLEKEGIARKGLVLASLMKFKQICNHPDQYLGNKEYHPEYSGKFIRLKEICETIYEKRERVLIFTQFREMVQPISDFLELIFNRNGLILHGGTPVKTRQSLVQLFNGEDYIPYMVLSLKAGGVGLNLTSANHVIHFDRWWNPAVENQATDRAYRIGQERNVMVHKFITIGSIEEKIDAMIEAKSKLSGELISASGESWITELSNESLMSLFRLT